MFCAFANWISQSKSEYFPLIHCMWLMVPQPCLAHRKVYLYIPSKWRTTRWTPSTCTGIQYSLVFNTSSIAEDRLFDVVWERDLDIKTTAVWVCLHGSSDSNSFLRGGNRTFRISVFLNHHTSGVNVSKPLGQSQMYVARNNIKTSIFRNLNEQTSGTIAV